MIGVMVGGVLKLVQFGGAKRLIQSVPLPPADVLVTDGNAATLQAAINGMTAGQVLGFTGTYTGLFTVPGGSSGWTLRGLDSGATLDGGNVTATSGQAVLNLTAGNNINCQGFTVQNLRHNPALTGDGDFPIGVKLGTDCTARAVLVRRIRQGIGFNHGTGSEVILCEVDGEAVGGSSSNGMGCGVQARNVGQTTTGQVYVHDCRQMLRGTPAGGDDTGGSAIILSGTPNKSSTGGVYTIVEDCVTARNYAVSADYGYDGSGVEMYKTQSAIVRRNTLIDSPAVSECGTGSGIVPQDVYFQNNIGGFSSTWAATGVGLYAGLYFRLGQDWFVSGNVIFGAWWGFLIGRDGSSFAGLTNNHVQTSNISVSNGAGWALCLDWNTPSAANNLPPLSNTVVRNGSGGQTLYSQSNGGVAAPAGTFTDTNNSGTTASMLATYRSTATTNETNILAAINAERALYW